MTRKLPTAPFILIMVLTLIALIGLVTLLATRLINDTVCDQFHSHHLQLVTSLSQQTETYFDGLYTSLTHLSLQPDISAPVDDADSRDHALSLMAQEAAEHTSIMRSIIRFDHQGQALYAWPVELDTALAAGQPPPYGLPSRLTSQTEAGLSVSLDVELIPASRRDDPDGTFLLVAPVYTPTQTTQYIAYELNLNALFERIMGFVNLGSDGQLWVINGVNNILFRANDRTPLEALLDELPLASLVSFRQPVIEEYGSSDDERLAIIAPTRLPNETLVLILSRRSSTPRRQVWSDLQFLFALSVGAILLVFGSSGLVIRRLIAENARHQREVHRRETARALLEISRALNSTLDLEDVLRRIMGELYNIVPYDSAAILLLDRSKLAIVAHRGAGQPDHARLDLALDEAQAAREVLHTGHPLVINDTQQDDRWADLTPDSAIRAWLGLPLHARGATVGVLSINSHTPDRFKPEEVEMAEAFADHASVALQNARLHDLEVKQIEQELSIARQIQTSLLPAAAPDMPELDIAVHTTPARQVSGDYFQYLSLPNGRLGIAVGDVSGKGIPAAMLMTMITTAIRDEANTHFQAADLLNALNQRLLARTQATGLNSALMIGIFDPSNHQLEIANGGMVQPYLRQNGSAWDFVPVGGYPLGMSGSMRYQAKTIALEPGALLLFFSDGVVEAQNQAGELYGFDRLEALLNSLPDDLSAQAIIDRILASVHEYLDGEEPQDDLTILAVRLLRVSPTTAPRPTAAGRS